ncbi:MAG: CGNR zinc finger domain-containing protein [Corynebacterium casei]|nr:CGNR zinc finger domain-containing protein [Corynebacterium casei]
MNAPLLPPAPGASEHPSLALLNTTYSLPGNSAIELLDAPQTATDWLIDQDLVPQGTELLEYCHGKLTSLRTQLRLLFEAQVAQQVPDANALAQVNAAIRTAPQTLMLEHVPGEGFIQIASHPVTQLVEHAMARIAEDAALLLTSDEAPLLEECGAPSCNRLFLRTHGRRHWCSTRCGDRVRAARAYAKKKQATTT